MRTPFLFVALSFACTACSNSPMRPATYTTPDGDNWVITYVASGVSGSIHVKVNGKIAASGSFGAVAGSRANGAGTYAGHNVAFSCVDRYRPDCFVYVDGKQAAELHYNDPSLDHNLQSKEPG